MFFRLQVKFQKQWTSFDLMKSKILQFFSPAWESLSIVSSFLDLLIDDTIFIHPHQLVGPLPIRRPFNVMVWFGSISVYSVKRMPYQNLLFKLCLKVWTPKPFPNIQGSGRDFIIESTSRNMPVKLIYRWCVFFC